MLDVVSGQVNATRLVGRKGYLAALRGDLEQLRAGESSTVLIGGEAGVGKSRLIEEFCGSLEEQVIIGHCLELGEEGLPYAPFADALRQLVHRDGRAVLDGMDHEFARLLPALGSAEGGDRRRGRFFDVVAALFERVSEPRPLVLVLEDLHWADRSTRDLLDFLVRGARLPRVLLLGTYRSDELHRGHPLRPYLAELDRVRGVRRFELERLDHDDIAEMLAQLLGPGLKPAVVDDIAERTQGNPFFIEQLTVGDSAAGVIPANLRDLLLTRVDALNEVAQKIVRVAAVGGTRFGHLLLSRVCENDQLETVLRELVTLQLVIPDAEDGYVFRHALVREAVYEDLLPGERTRLHARYAQVIEAEPRLVPAGRAAAELSHHWLAARNDRKALLSAKHAADEAARRHAYAEQAGLLERVLELWERVEDCGFGYADLLEETAIASIQAGFDKRGLKLTRAALAELDHDREPLRAARLLLRRAKLLRNAGSSNGIPELRRAQALLGQVADARERVQLTADVVQILLCEHDQGSAVVAREVLAEAGGLGDLAINVAAQFAVGETTAGRLPIAETLPAKQALADRARAAGDLPALAQALVSVSDGLFGVGRYQDSADAAAEGVSYADRSGVSRTSGITLLANHAEALLALGRWEEADAQLARSARHDPPGIRSLPWLTLRAQLLQARGDAGAELLTSRALAFLSKPFLPSQPRLVLLNLRILAALRLDDPQELKAATQAGLEDSEIAQQPRYGWPLLAGAAEAAQRLADPELIDRVRHASTSVPCRYPAEHAYAAQTTAILEGGRHRWLDAVAAWRSDGQHYPLALALLGLASAEAEGGDRAAAISAVSEAISIAKALGASELTLSAETLARRIGRRSGPDPGSLTSREREVLGLVDSGRSNNQIAQTLYISPKTVSVHVSRIIAKLEVSNRGEAAATARRLGLLN